MKPREHKLATLIFYLIAAVVAVTVFASAVAPVFASLETLQNLTI
jgi:hypothetical protein